MHNNHCWLNKDLLSVWKLALILSFFYLLPNNRFTQCTGSKTSHCRCKLVTRRSYAQGELWELLAVQAAVNWPLCGSPPAYMSRRPCSSACSNSTAAVILTWPQREVTRLHISCVWSDAILWGFVESKEFHQFMMKRWDSFKIIVQLSKLRHQAGAIDVTNNNSCAVPATHARQNSSMYLIQLNAIYDTYWAPPAWRA